MPSAYLRRLLVGIFAAHRAIYTNNLARPTRYSSRCAQCAEQNAAMSPVVQPARPPRPCQNRLPLPWIVGATEFIGAWPLPLRHAVHSVYLTERLLHAPPHTASLVHTGSGERSPLPLRHTVHAPCVSYREGCRHQHPAPSKPHFTHTESASYRQRVCPPTHLFSTGSLPLNCSGNSGVNISYREGRAGSPAACRSLWCVPPQYMQAGSPP